MIKEYYQLTKPGIVFGNATTAAAGFFLASKGHFHILSFFVMLFGLSCIVAAGCVLNNYFDRFADQKMDRTKSRPLAKGSISLKNTIQFGFVLLLLGILMLMLFTTILAAMIAILGFVVYVGFYTIWKYKTPFATELGSFAGAAPPVVGYTAVSGHLDLGAAILFAIVAFWQMPHFFAIAIYRSEEYASASIPVLPLTRGVNITKYQMLFYMALFTAAALSLPLFGFAGYIYTALALALSLYWLWKTAQGFKAENDKRWARKVFLSSLLVIMGLCSAIALDSLL